MKAVLNRYCVWVWLVPFFWAGESVAKKVLTDGAAPSAEMTQVEQEMRSRRSVRPQDFLLTLAKEAFRATHPSVVAATGTGEVLARNFPVIQDRLRRTRDAIAALGDGDDGIVESGPDIRFQFIGDDADRAALIRHLDDLGYLLDLYKEEASWDVEAPALDEIRTAIAEKETAINRLLRIWGQQPDELAGGGGSHPCQRAADGHIDYDAKWQWYSFFGAGGTDFEAGGFICLGDAYYTYSGGSFQSYYTNCRQSDRWQAEITEIKQKDGYTNYSYRSSNGKTGWGSRTPQ